MFMFSVFLSMMQVTILDENSKLLIPKHIFTCESRANFTSVDSILHVILCGIAGWANIHEHNTESIYIKSLQELFHK